MTVKIKKVFLMSLCVFSLLFITCQNQLNAPIPEGKLVEILADVHLAEAMTQTEKAEIRDSLVGMYCTQIFAHHGFTRKDFDSTMSIYTHYPEQFDSVYSKVDRLIKVRKDTVFKSR